MIHRGRRRCGVFSRPRWLLFPDLHAAIDWTRGCEFLDKELQRISVGAKLGRRLADVLVRVHLRDGSALLVLVHIEVQGQRETDFDRRMFVYHYRAFDRERQPVISLAILTDANEDWRPAEFGYEFFGTSIRLKFRAVKLLDLRARWNELAASDNPVAVIVMTQLKAYETRRAPQQRLHWKWELIRGLYRRGLKADDIRELFERIDSMMQLPEELEMQLDTFINEYEAEQGRKYVSGYERRAIQRGVKQGLEQGLQQGLQQGLHTVSEISILQLQKRLGALPATLLKQVEKLSVEQLRQLGVALLDFNSVKDLSSWLRKHKTGGKNGKRKRASQTA